MKPDTTTTNGMPAFSTTGNAVLNFYSNTSKGRSCDLSESFACAYREDKELALRALFQARDVRGGKGERKLFRDCLRWLSKNDPRVCRELIKFIPEYGRWDDMLHLIEKEVWPTVIETISNALKNGDGLCAKWMPRKATKNDLTAVAVRRALGFGEKPKQYRKLLVDLNNTVETKMCAGEWKNINYSHVPSLAGIRYNKAFSRRDPERYHEYLESITKGTTKVKVTTLYPYDVYTLLKVAKTTAATDYAEAAWKELPNYVGELSILPLVDTSGSMTSCPATNTISCAEMAMSLGLYLADKNKGPFAKTILNFNTDPHLYVIPDNLPLRGRFAKIMSMPWGGSTNIMAAFRQVLSIANKFKVSSEVMPAYILILSDMQFNSCTRDPTKRMMELISKEYEESGYQIPRVIFWNLNKHESSNTPVEASENGTILVSGFNPVILKSLLKGTFEDKNEDGVVTLGQQLTPEAFMREDLMQDRYDLGFEWLK